MPNDGDNRERAAAAPIVTLAPVKQRTTMVLISTIEPKTGPNQGLSRSRQFTGLMTPP